MAEKTEFKTVETSQEDLEELEEKIRRHRHMPMFLFRPLELGHCLDVATHRVWKSSLFGICRLHALLHSLVCLCQGIGSRRKNFPKLYLYRPFGNSSYFSGHY